MTFYLRSFLDPFFYQELSSFTHLLSAIYYHLYFIYTPNSSIFHLHSSLIQRFHSTNKAHRPILITLQSHFAFPAIKSPSLSFDRICPSFSCADTKSPDTCAAINDNSPAITVDATNCDNITELTGVLSYTSPSPPIHSFISSMQACCGASPVPPPIVPTSIEGIVTDM